MSYEYNPACRCGGCRAYGQGDHVNPPTLASRAPAETPEDDLTRTRRMLSDTQAAAARLAQEKHEQRQQIEALTGQVEFWRGCHTNACARAEKLERGAPAETMGEPTPVNREEVGRIKRQVYTVLAAMLANPKSLCRSWIPEIANAAECQLPAPASPEASALGARKP